MNIKQLIEELNKIKDKEQTVYLSTDEEGNDFKNVDVIVEVKKSDGYAGVDDKIIMGVVVYPVG